MITALALLLGLYIGYFLPIWFGKLIGLVIRKRVLKKFSPKPVNEMRLCKVPHQWIDATSVNENGELGKIHVCSVCGFLPTKDMMLTESALEKIVQIRKFTELDETIMNDFANMEEVSLKEHFGKEIEGGLDFQKVLQVYNAGQTLQERFILYRMTKREECNKPEEVTANER